MSEAFLANLEQAVIRDFSSIRTGVEAERYFKSRLSLEWKNLGQEPEKSSLPLLFCEVYLCSFAVEQDLRTSLQSASEPLSQIQQHQLADLWGAVLAYRCSLVDLIKSVSQEQVVNLRLANSALFLAGMALLQQVLQSAAAVGCISNYSSIVCGLLDRLVICRSECVEPARAEF